MVTQVLAMIVAMTAICLLSWLRYLLMARHENRQRYYRASVVRFVDTDWDTQSDNSSNSGLDSRTTTIPPVLKANDLSEWPAELEEYEARYTRIMLNKAVLTSRLKAVAVVIAALTIVAGHTAFAQSTIFNIPTTDVVAPKKVYFEFDFVSHLESHDNGGFQSYVPRVVVGVAKGVEVGLNVASTDSAAPTIVYAQPNIKWQFYTNEKTGVASSLGAIAYTPLRNRDVNDTFGLFYGNVSKKFKGNHGPRITIGGYGVAGLDADVDKGGAIVGYEQPIAGKVSFVADWFSGKNGFGYATPGFSFSLPKNQVVNIGYSFGNYLRKNNGLFVYYGVTF